MKLTVLGIDPAFAHMGLCIATLLPSASTPIITIEHLRLVSTEGRDKKEVRRSSDDLRRAKELHAALRAICDEYQPAIAFCEVPHGSQSARASWSLGISVGVLASVPVPIVQVNAIESKIAAVGKKTASKQEMIDWAHRYQPQANWLVKGGRLLQANEHLADAYAAINSGVRTEEFKLFAATTQQPTQRRKLIR